MAFQSTILIVGTLDTKLDEISYLRSQIVVLSDNACKTQILDVGRSTKSVPVQSTIDESEILTPLAEHADELKDMARGDYVDKAIEICTPLVRQLVSEGKIQAIISAGGSTNSSLVSALMRNGCPIGFPKLIVSTMASGDVKPYIEETDITMMYSVVDIAGINSILRNILSNAAGAISGMAKAYASLQKGMEGLKVSGRKKIAVTMFGVTTPCVDNIRKILTTTPHDVSEYELYVFHATGSGGRAMERLIEEGQIDAVIDLTTTEIADELFGGVLSAGPHRLESAVKKGIPMVVSVGACDMVNFGPKDTVPDSVKDRNFYYHNPTVTLMRTNTEENTQIAKVITSKLKQHVKYPHFIRVVLPKGGVSMLDQAQVEKPTTSPVAPTSQTKPVPEPVKGTTGEPWHDPEADTALFENIIKELDGTKIEVFEYPDNINDDQFAISICEHLLEVMGVDPRSYRLANARRRKWSFSHGMTIERLQRRNSIEIPDA